MDLCFVINVVWVVNWFQIDVLVVVGFVCWDEVEVIVVLIVLDVVFVLVNDMQGLLQYLYLCCISVDILNGLVCYFVLVVVFQGDECRYGLVFVFGMVLVKVKVMV